MSNKLEETMREFQDETGRLIQLQFGYDLVGWCVLVSSGNIMVVVPGTSSTTAEGAVEKALKRWKNRKNEPFIYTAKERESQLPPHKCGSLCKTEAQQASSG